jgi:substrate-binding family protein
MGHRLSRRTFLQGAVAAGALAAAPAVIVRPGWSQTGAIKIGVLEPRSGPVKYVGDKHVAALGHAVEQVNGAGGLLGRKLEMVVADSEMKGDIANDLIFSDKEFRYFGNDFPYIGRPVRISRDDIAQPARDTGNRRCA